MPVKNRLFVLNRIISLKEKEAEQIKSANKSSSTTPGKFPTFPNMKGKHK